MTRVRPAHQTYSDKEVRQLFNASVLSWRIPGLAPLAVRVRALLWRCLNVARSWRGM